ncbi:hypothetical protein, partial [Streptomyces sp. NPDC048392]|uniref:hypothetical protein n=1 Tax=Streptomyces sp. NPDC048392 TaxID=3365543 RepID=UPI00371A51EB
MMHSPLAASFGTRACAGASNSRLRELHCGLNSVYGIQFPRLRGNLAERQRSFSLCSGLPLQYPLRG